jgi:hypothetical protein
VFPGHQPRDRDNLWRLLVVITARKAAHQIRDETHQKRGGAAMVAKRLGCVTRTVKRKLGVIRAIWEKEGEA